MKIAIYSRKSKFTGKGESIENQIELCKNQLINKYNIKEENIKIYQDEGFTGYNTNRPQFQEMIKKYHLFLNVRQACRLANRWKSVVEVYIANQLEKHKLSIARWKWRKCVSKSWLDVQKLDIKAMQEGKATLQVKAQKIYVTLYSKSGE